MCLYPRLIRNRKYTVNKKNGGDVPTPNDPRVLAVPVGCGECIECRKKRGREWSVRLQEEIRHDKTGIFVTLTLSNESFRTIYNSVIKEESANINGYDLDNAIATKAVRYYTELDRKHSGKAPKHWLITELGHNGTENIHLHGIIFGRTANEIKDRWKHGFVFCGTYVNETTVNYIIKYATKIDEKNKGFKGKILSSKGIGKAYTTRSDSRNNTYNKNGTREEYITRQGAKMGLPTYYRNLLYTDEQKEKLWLEKLDKNIRWINGKKIDISQGEDDYFAYLKVAQAKNARLGYGKGELTWEQKQYQNERRNFKIQQRLNKNTNNENNDQNNLH